MSHLSFFNLPTLIFPPLQPKQAIYLPFLYQAKGRTAVQSGIDVIPFSIATIFGTGVSGGIIRATGRYKPFLIGSPWFAAIAGGLFYTVTVDTSNAKLIGYQIILGMSILNHRLHII